MLIKDGNKKLQEFANKNNQETFAEITKGIWHISGLACSNAIVVEADSSIILIDTLDTLEKGKKLLDFIHKQTGKKVKTIIYTHGHPDHLGGAGAFTHENIEIIAFKPKTIPLEKSNLLQDILKKRATRQFGYTLTDAECITQGIGPREGAVYGEQRAFAAPTTIYAEDKVIREIDGIQLEMLRLPGESEDAISIWLPQKQVLCCGDNFYACFPNFYAIRGGQYRDLAVWTKSIETILLYPIQYLLPGHSPAICTKETVKEVLSNFKNMIDYVLTKTLEGINQGKNENELACEIKLPIEYANLPYFGEYYGCLEWTVRGIYSAYIGWFDGNPTNLHPLSTIEYSNKTIELMGGPQKVTQAAKEAIKKQEYQWCLELCDLILANDKANKEILLLKADTLLQIAEYETSANGRHYYIAYAKEIMSGI